MEQTKVVTAQAPVNIAVIKYWGKSDEKLKIPINDSLSGTLDVHDMCTTTTVYMSPKFEHDKLLLNGKEQDLTNESPAKIMLNEMREVSTLDKETIGHKTHIISINNFPTAAGLASSAAGYACLAYSLGHCYGVTDISTLSKIARKGSGSACRSLFGGFVQWGRGHDHDSSVSRQVVDQNHWPEMRVLICVVNDREKDVSSSSGMARSVKTSPLIKYRADHVVPERIAAIKDAILNKDFESFANITMQDSNEFHAICLDTFPPIFYLNETSRQIIKICSLLNEHYGLNKVAYTFDAGPNGCIYLLEDFVNQFIHIIKRFFPMIDDDGNPGELQIKGRPHKVLDQNQVETICDYLKSKGVESNPNKLNYLINTSIGGGPKLIEAHLSEN